MPGTGKSTLAKKIKSFVRGTLLRTDIIRKQLLKKPRYTEKEKALVYSKMFALARKELKKGKNVILDATFAKHINRRMAKLLAKKAGADFLILEAVAPEKIVKKRLLNRKGNVSQATFQTYLEHKNIFQPIKEPHYVIDTSKNIDKQLEDVLMLKRPLKVGLDFDGVIVDHTKNKIKVVKELFGIAIKREQAQSEVLKKLLSERRYKRVKKLIYGKMSLKSKPISGAIAAIKQLKEEGFDLFIVSRRNNPKIPLAWLRKYSLLKTISRAKIFFVKNEEAKAKKAEKLKLDVFLDDKTKVLKQMKSVSNRVLLNFYKLKGLRGDWENVNSWQEFLKLVRKIKNS